MSQNCITDEELLNGLRQESASAFKQIFDLHWNKLYQIAYRKTGSKEIAEELVQEIFLNIWLKRKSITIKSSLEAYLVTSVKYSIINHYKAQIVRSRFKLTTHQLPAAANFTEEQVLTEELNSTFKKALESLSKKTRQIFEKSRFQNLSNKEIAYELQLTDKAVEFHITKSLKHLKVFLKDFVLPLFIICFSPC
ncbi:RNA polymerase sigma factor [Adhaeribacter radiodurans]|uniref:RNA polymerase sigma-70 factor n=1 Tax=Adhaeribacter radiodurans TaxID=2745197 RepID=A0A7L7L7B9_9BACT|nr:RNA polymerase sigma-70 factor [Adhaeribacter radiodurans]QMU28249.1 RNA polymerase sigma-70 factor [Adhaeribacter radiodurans]